MISHDKWYKKWNASSVNSACIIRVTNRCNQKCRHCCFRSGPGCVGQMSTGMCEKINTWVPKKIPITVMGGEFTVLDNYPEIIVALSCDRSRIRLVTNGSWANRNVYGDEDSDKFFDTIEQIKEASCSTLIDIVISQDSWHDGSGHFAASLLRKNSLLADFIGIDFIESAELSLDNIIPVGRAWDNNIVPHGNIKCSCKTMCNMIITEDGMLCRCPYGYFPWKHFSETTWFDAQEYIWGWRSEKLADGMDCISCMKTVESNKLIGSRKDDRRIFCRTV